MRAAFRVLALTVLSTAALAPRAQAQAERLTLSVAAPVRIAHQTLAPGAYEVTPTYARGVFVIENKETAERRFVNCTGMTGGAVLRPGPPRAEWEKDSTGDIAITALYFPQSGMTYRFSAAEGKKEVGTRIALRR